MTDAVQIALIAGGTAAIPAMFNAILAFMNSSAIRRAERHIAASKIAVEQTNAAIITLEKNTNSIKDALVKVTGESEHAKGKLEGAAEAADSTNIPAALARQERESSG